VTANLAAPSEGYLANALYHGAGLSNAVVRWTRMPIRVLFVRHSNPSLLSWRRGDHEDTAIYAFNRWSESLGGLISYAFSNVLDNDAALASRKAAADIIVEWTADTYGGLLGDTTPSASVCSSCTPRANDLQMHVKLHCIKASSYTYLEPFNLPHFTGTQFRATNIHHVGHALGLIGDPTTMGHSPDPNDVMYGHSPMPMSPTNLLPSLRDINTLKQLYSRPADITRL
jgi:predicted Zn-dependent protease